MLPPDSLIDGLLPPPHPNPRTQDHICPRLRLQVRPLNDLNIETSPNRKPPTLAHTSTTHTHIPPRLRLNRVCWAYGLVWVL